MNSSQLSCAPMKWCLWGMILCGVLSAQDKTLPQPGPELQHVLSQMDQAAASFHTTQASFVWDQYQKVVDETDSQKGTVYFRRSGNEVQMAADIREPTPPKYV